MIPPHIPKPSSDKLSIDMVRQALAVINLEDVDKEKEQSEQERVEYTAAIAAVFPRLEKDIKKFLYEQLIKTSMQAETWEQVLVGRGVFAGMEILLDHWKKANTEHLDHSKPQEEFDRHHVFGEA